MLTIFINFLSSPNFNSFKEGYQCIFYKVCMCACLVLISSCTIAITDKTYDNDRITSYGDNPLLYKGDSMVSDCFAVNSVAYEDGTLIVARAGGRIDKIQPKGDCITVLDLTGVSEWRCLYMDKDGNVFASPHATFASYGPFNMRDRGLYKLTKGESTMRKVLELYNPESTNVTITQENDDSIWSLCQDDDGYLYAGVYCHSKRFAPRIYRSVDCGETWQEIYCFTSDLPNGHHIHSIVYSTYNKSLYCIIGEQNTVFSSKDHGLSWTNLNVRCSDDKGCSMLAVSDGIIIGSDSAYECMIHKLYYDNRTIIPKAKVWANIIFAIRKSDLTGWIYAFTRIDASVNALNYMPPLASLTDESILQSWKDSSPKYLDKWEHYHSSTSITYPLDAIRPQHCGLLISKDEGETWHVLYREFVTSEASAGFWSAGYFKDGECLAGLYKKEGTLKATNPLIINEKKHIIDSDGYINIGEDIYSSLELTSIVKPIL